MTSRIKNPLGIVAERGEGGIVVAGEKIVELVSKGQTPRAAIDETFDVSEHVVLPGLRWSRESGDL